VHTERLARELNRRDELYAHFNELSMKLMVDALDHSLDQVGKLVGLLTAMGARRASAATRFGAGTYHICNDRPYRAGAMLIADVMARDR
jgi:hypothetical protein